MMKTYDFRINRPKPDDEYFKRLHLGQHSNDTCILPKARDRSKTKWLRSIAPHLQQFIFRTTCDRAKGQNRVGKISLTNSAAVSALENIGISKKWIISSFLVELLKLDTCFIKGDYVHKASRLEFKLSEKICHYFDDSNRARQTQVAHFLYIRLLKETPPAIMN
ncbi:unnamed protein product [Rotaria sp. Silwood2]|nr:unnamed protein product [Rotaria sp. Silwood2]